MGVLSFLWVPEVNPGPRNALDGIALNKDSPLYWVGNGNAKLDLRESVAFPQPSAVQYARQISKYEKSPYFPFWKYVNDVS